MGVYVGVDQALKKIGVCVIIDDHAVLQELLRPPADARGPERLVTLRNLLSNTLYPYQGRIDRAAMEAQSLGSLGDIDQLGQINGIVQVLLTDFGAPPLLVPPSTLKKFVTGHGGASKGEMMRVSSKRWGYDFTQDDICDAHGLARMARECVEQDSTYRHEIEAVHSLLRQKKRKRPVRRLAIKAI